MSGNDAQASEAPENKAADASVPQADDDDEEDDIKLDFTLYSVDSWEAQLEREKQDKVRAEENKRNQGEAHLVDGELKFDSEEDHSPKKHRNPDLIEGSSLPEIYEVDPVLNGKPLEEIDKLIKDKTFVVLAKRFKKQYIYRFSSTPSFFYFTPWNPVRKAALYITTHQLFDYFIILTILTNCVFLAMPDLAAAETAEYVFLAIYTLEMLIKFVARGLFLNSYTYLRDPWNWLDSGVIFLAFITIAIEESMGSSGIGNMQGIRTFRVFRILRTVSIVPGLKTIVNALLRAFRMLLEVMMLIVFCLMVFSLFSLQLYMGVLRQKCVAELPAFNETPSYSHFQYYNDWNKNTSNWYEDDDGYVLCGNATSTRKCPNGYVCLPDIGDNPNSGYTGFDHFGWAMLNSFQLITLDFWEDTYNKILQTVGPWNVLYFVIVVFFGSFYLLNLMLAVVAMSYEQEAESAGKFGRHRPRPTLPSTTRSKLTDLRKPNPTLSMFRSFEEEQMEKDKAKKKRKAKKDQAKVKAATETETDTGKPTDNPSTNGITTVKSNSVVPSPAPRKHNPRKPMVKMPSKDSGTGNSVESSRSNGSNGDEGLGSSLDGTGTKTEIKVLPFKKPFLKQPSSGMVSASGVTLEKHSLDGFEEEDLQKETEEGDESPEPRNTIGKDYVAKTYPDIVIIEVEDGKIDVETEEGEYVNRNCYCCYNCCKGRLFVPWLKVQKVCYAIASEPLFDLFVMVCIVINTIFMATEHYGQPEELTQLLRISNWVFTAVFTLEAIVKLCALTKHYFAIGWNIFDLLIVIASLIDLGVEDIDGLSVFRTFRLLRVIKLAQSWPTMRLLLTIIMNTLGALGYLTIILAIVIYIFAIIGLQLFNKSYTAEKFDPDPVPRWNFKDIFHSIMMIFRVLCGEWIEPLWDCMIAANETCMAVFLPALILGNFIVLNLFLALLLNAFASDALRKAKEDAEDTRLKLAIKRIRDLCCCCFKKETPRVNSVGPDEEREDGDVVSLQEIEDQPKNDDNTAKKKAIVNGNHIPGEPSTDKATADKKQQNGVLKNKDNKDMSKTFDTKRDKFADFNKARTANQEKTVKKVAPAGASSSTHKDEDDLELGDEASTIQKDDKPEKEEEGEPDSVIVVEPCLPLCCTERFDCCTRMDENGGSVHSARWNAYRLFLTKVVEHKVFETIILILIAASSISLAFEDVHLYQNKQMQDALFVMNIMFAVLFTIEMILKLFANGLKKYYTSFWTILDFCIVVISWASIVADAYGVGNISAFRSLRTLRALRPLRAISRWQGMRIVVNALMMAIPAIMNVLVVGLVFWLIFSIMGVQFFAGKFYKCQDADGNTLDPSVTKDKTECLAKNYTWKNSEINFDNVGAGYLALFQVATFEGWMEVMIDAIDSTEVDKQPSFENSLPFYLYFVGFIIIGTFFILNLFIGVIIDNFNVLKKKYDGSYLDMFLTPGQRQYYNTIKKLGNRKPQKTVQRPKNKIQGTFYDIANSNKFELCIVVMIFLNMVSMGVEHYKQTQTVTDILDMVNIFFVVVFALEAIVKLIGLRFHYFRQPWNIFDCIIVIVSIVEIILDDILSSAFVSPTLFRVARIFRIGRVLRLIKAAKGIRKLLFALIMSLPALFNIGALLCLVLYIYAIICLSSFQNLKITAALDDDVVNFKTFANSFMLLFRLATSAGWNDVLEPMLIQPPDCNPDYYTRTDGELVADNVGDCGIPWLAILLLTSYIIIIFLVVINTFIAVILENFGQAHEQEEVGITEDDFEMFYSVWERYDPLATQFIKYEQLSNFVADLEKPLGIDKPNEIALVSFDLPIVEGDKLHCLDVLMSLVKYVLGAVEETPEFKEMYDQMEERFSTAFPTRVNTSRKSSTMARKKEDVAAKTLQRAWRSWKTQKQLKSITALAMQQQSKTKQTSVDNRRVHSIRQLGQRVSTALRSFFANPRPSSAISRSSIKSPGASGSSTVKPKKYKAQSNMELPTVSVLYSAEADHGDIDL